MFKTHRQLLAIVFCLSFFKVGVEGQTARNQKISKRPAQSIADPVFAGLVRPDEPGFAALIRCAGSGGYWRTEGVRELRTKAKIDASTNFRLASFTKQFTAMAIMFLVHDRKLQYERSLAELFPDFPDYGRNITIRNLLNHTSGLPDYEDLMEAAEKTKGPLWSSEHQIQDAEVLELLKKEKSGKFAPGTSWSYSNSGYVLLGLAIVRVSGKSYGEFLRERIFAPLKMDRTIVYQKGKNQVANRAFGHSRANGADTFTQTDQSPTSATLGDGGIYSNLQDLAKWDTALRNNTLLGEKEMLPALTPVRLADGSEPRWPRDGNSDNLHPGQAVSYGFGWFLDPFPDPYYNHLHPRMWHTGTTMGFRTVIERFTEADGLTVIILCNRTDLDPEKLALQIAPYYPPLK